MLMGWEYISGTSICLNRHWFDFKAPEKRKKRCLPMILISFTPLYNSLSLSTVVTFSELITSGGGIPLT